MPLDIAQLRSRIVIQLRTDGRDNFGQRVLSWTDVATVWAGITTLPTGGRETPVAQAIQSESTHQVQIRYRAGMTPALRLRYGTRYFQIQAVTDPDGRRAQLLLLCSEGLGVQ